MADMVPTIYLLLYPRDLPGRLCCPVSGSQAVQAGVKVRCQAWALETGEGAASHYTGQMRRKYYRGGRSLALLKTSFSQSEKPLEISRAWP